MSTDPLEHDGGGGGGGGGGRGGRGAVGGGGGRGRGRRGRGGGGEIVTFDLLKLLRWFKHKNWVELDAQQ